MQVAESHLSERPEIEQRFGVLGRARCIEDAGFHVQNLVQAIRFSSPSLFIAYVQWTRRMLEARRIAWRDLERNLEILGEEIASVLAPDEATIAAGYINAALAADTASDESFLSGTPREPIARAYLAALLRADRRSAIDIIDSAAMPVRELYLDVFQPVQREIGRLWQNNEISVAQEHFCTASTQAIMAQFYRQILSTKRLNRSVVVACVGNELHEIGARMVADFFEMEGWDGIYLGANTPANALVDLVCRERPQLVALGVTMTFHLSTASELVERLRADQRCAAIRIIVGGYLFQNREDLWRSIGADGCAADAADAVRVGSALVDGI